MRHVVVESRFFPLLSVLVVMLFFVYPLVLEHGEPGLLLTIFLVTTFVVSVRAIANRRALVVALVLLALPMFASRYVIAVTDTTWVPTVHACISITFYAVVTIACLARVLDNSPVNEDKILGAICVYLLIGLIFAFVYEIIYLVDPTAIAIGREVEERGVGDFWVFTYFSYVTLTTLGYGDVLPTGLFARSMATLEAILGPLYLAILIARLVSLVDADSSARKTRADAEARGKGS